MPFSSSSPPRREGPISGFMRKYYRRLRDWQRARNSSYGMDISTPEARREAQRHANWVDHAILRRRWSNMHPLGRQAWRSNQPGPERFARLREMGIRSILNLRGPSAFAVYLFEREACAESGIALIDHQISAYRLDPRETYLELFEIFDRIERPFLMHCKSGADRSGIAAALYLMDQEGLPVERAMEELALKYLHWKGSKAGILRFLLQNYAEDTRRAPMPVRDWFASRYDREALSAAFRARTGRR